jgi:hypothetical protein
VFETQFGKSVAKYGNPADAASVWFSGRPLAKAGNASDVLGTTVPQYAQKFMAAYEGGANTPAMMRAPGFASSSGIPANVGLPVAPVLNALAGPQPAQQGNALAMQAAPMTQLQAAPIAAPQPAPALSAFDSAQQTAPALSPYQQARQDARQRELDVYKQKEEIKRSASQELTPVQEQKMRTDIGEARANAGESMATLQETVRAAKDVLALPEEAKNAISGYTGRYTPNLSASAKDAQTKFNDIVGQITAMSKASTGPIGSMAVQEWKILADQVASLDLTNMDAKTLDRQMKIIVNRAEGLMNRTRANYTNIYGPLMEKYKGQFDLPAPTPSIAIGIDPRAIEKLRNDPSMAKAFDEHFGRPGAAAAILGK